MQKEKGNMKGQIHYQIRGQPGLQTALLISFWWF